MRRLRTQLVQLYQLSVDLAGPCDDAGYPRAIRDDVWNALKANERLVRDVERRFKDAQRALGIED